MGWDGMGWDGKRVLWNQTSVLNGNSIVFYSSFARHSVPMVHKFHAFSSCLALREKSWCVPRLVREGGSTLGQSWRSSLTRLGFSRMKGLEKKKRAEMRKEGRCVPSYLPNKHHRLGSSHRQC